MHDEEAADVADIPKYTKSATERLRSALNSEEEKLGKGLSNQQGTSSPKASTNSSVSDQELSNLKKEDPVAALRLMLSLRGSATSLSTSSSTTSLSSIIPQESPEDLLNQLKAKILEGNLLARLDQDSSERFAISNILKKLLKAEPRPELLAFLVEFSALFDQLSTKVGERRALQRRREAENKLQEQALTAAQKAQAKFAAIEEQGKKNQAALVDWEAKIQQYQEEIKALQLKLSEAENQKKLVEDSLKASSETDIRNAALATIQHLDNVSQHQDAVAPFDKELHWLEAAIAVNSAALDRQKALLRNL